MKNIRYLVESALLPQLCVFLQEAKNGRKYKKDREVPYSLRFVKSGFDEDNAWSLMCQFCCWWCVIIKIDESLYWRSVILMKEEGQRYVNVNEKWDKLQ